jgi:hypothetical protein
MDGTLHIIEVVPGGAGALRCPFCWSTRVLLSSSDARTDWSLRGFVGGCSCAGRAHPTGKARPPAARTRNPPPSSRRNAFVHTCPFRARLWFAHFPPVLIAGPRTCGHAQGDILLGLNGQLVMMRSVEELRPFILGPTGTQIELFIQRGAKERLAYARPNHTRSLTQQTPLQEARNSPCCWYEAGGQAAAATRVEYDQTYTASAVALGAVGRGGQGGTGEGEGEQEIPPVCLCMDMVRVRG